MDFNADLHKILLENETHMFLEKDKEIQFIVFIGFDDLEEFTSALGYTHFDEGGLPVYLKDNCVCIELREIFLNSDYRLKDYKHCFNERDFVEYQDAIEQFDSEQ